MPEPYAEQYQMVVKIHLDGNEWGAVVGPDPIQGVAGFGYTVNEAMSISRTRWTSTTGIGKNSPSRRTS
jgi:hypothetical protein